MARSPHGLYFSLREIEGVASALHEGPASTATLASACEWDTSSAWGEVKQMEQWHIEKIDTPPFKDTSEVLWQTPIRRARLGNTRG